MIACLVTFRFADPRWNLLVVKMHSWAQLRHTKSEFHPSKSTSYWLKLYHDAFDASAHAFKWGAPEFIDFSRSYGIFPNIVATPNRSVFLFVCFLCTSLDLVGVDQ